MAKGSEFERAICKQLSLWWTDDKRDDIFWRTAGSGARATMRGSKRTFGQYGDVQATDPIGQPLIDFLTIECKRGYPGAWMYALIDSPEHLNKDIVKFIKQAMNSHTSAKSFSWCIITRRDRGKTMIFFPASVFQILKEREKMIKMMFPFIKTKALEHNITIYGTSLDSFCRLIDPSIIKEIIYDQRKTKKTT